MLGFNGAAYSLWSNKSFKQPLLFASAASVVANICFCISYDWGGMAMLTAARFVTGLGRHMLP